MARTRATASRGEEATPDPVADAPVRGRGRGRGRARRAAPVRGYVRADSPKPKLDPREDQVPLEYAVAPLLQDTLL